MPNSRPIPDTFEASLQELESIVQNMESNSLTLEQSLTAYERGVALAKNCQEKLDVAGKQVLVLQNNLLNPLEDQE